MKIAKRSVALGLSGLITTGVIAGIGITSGQVHAQDASEVPAVEELFVPLPPLTLDARDYLQRTIGKLYVTFNDGYAQWGTATVVLSESQDMLLTSAALLTDKRRDRYERVADIRFVPGERLSQGEPRQVEEPYGSWTARAWQIAPGYDREAPASAESNIAVVLLNTMNGQHIQDVLDAAQGLCFNCADVRDVGVYSFNGEYENGSALDTTCRVIADFSNPQLPYGMCTEGRTAFKIGADGAPVIADIDPATGHGMVVAINTWFGYYPDGKTSNGGVVLGNAAMRLYEGYRGQ